MQYMFLLIGQAEKLDMPRDDRSVNLLILWL